MTLMELMTLIGLIFTFIGLMVQIAVAFFNIAWKISHEHKDDDNKKSEYPPRLPKHRLLASC